MPLLTSSLGRGILLIALTVQISSCTPTPGIEDLKSLSGYWEIEQVTFPNGDTRDFPPSTTTVDFYHLEGLQGWLKKVQPEINGRFSVNADAISLAVVQREDRIILQFKGREDSWEETLEVLNHHQLETLHENGLRYIYHRYEPIEISQ